MKFMHNRLIAKSWITVLGAGSKFIKVPRPVVLTGRGSSLELCDVIAQMGFLRVMIVTDDVLNTLGLPNAMRARLEAAGIATTTYAGVVPDPPFEVVFAGADAIREHRADALLAVGGGSTIDAAKAMGIAVTNTKPLRDLSGVLSVPTAGLPLFAIPTTAGTGSEVTFVSVVSDLQSGEKVIFADPKLMPTATAIDAELMVGVPPGVTAATGMDALTHAVEAYISGWATEDTDRYAEAATRMIFKNLKSAFENGRNIEARAALGLASHFAGLAFGQASVGYVHAIAHQLGAHYHVPHGLANATVLPKVLRFSEDKARPRLARLGRIVGVANDTDADSEASSKFVNSVEALNASLQIPTRVPSIQPEHIDQMAAAALSEAHKLYAVPKYMSLQECKQMFFDLSAAT